MRAPTFLQLARNGFGDGENAYAHSMAWFDRCLYVGTTRNNLCLIRTNPTRDTLRFWPVQTPPDIYSLDMRAQIHRYDPARDRWEHVHSSPLIEGTRGRRVPRDIGYRAMVVFEGRSDERPALYVSAMSWTEARGAVFLRSEDGETFERISQPGLRDESASSFRALVSFRGLLFTSPAGEGTSFYVARSPSVLVSDDPARGRWLPASEPGFGDPSNTAVSDLLVFDGYLYAGTLNPKEGFQLWRTRADGDPPYRWEKVLARGAGRGNLNEGVLSLAPFRGALYVGTHISMGGHDRKHGVGPAAAELIRVHPDGSWDLVAGRPRLAPDGVKVPLSGLGPGFGNLFNTYVWALEEHDGALYAGTLDISVFLPYSDPARQSPRARRILRELGGAEGAVEREGGFDLWRTRDGCRWECVTRSGFSNRYNYGARRLVSTPAGLFVGTANPFGPEVAVPGANGDWKYVENKRGGLEVWVSSGDGHVPPDSAHERVRTQLSRAYDAMMFSPALDEYYDGSDFTNYGYWTQTTRNQREACENLMDQLLALLPSTTGLVLDVACGKGGTTRYLLRYFRPRDVTGINISSRQLERCRDNAPGARFLLMDATNLAFEPNSFDAVICVEAAFHFSTRERFLREAIRVLKPGGSILLTDILFARRAHAPALGIDPANWLADPAAYQRLLEAVGFDHVVVEDASRECWVRHERHRARYAAEKLADRTLDLPTYLALRRRRLRRIASIRYYVLAAGRKPRAPRARAPRAPRALSA